MIADLNLASRPFRNRTLPWTIAATVMAVSLISLFLFMSETQRIVARADATERERNSLREQAGALQAQAAEVRESLTPGEVQTLEAARQLTGRKRFSWSNLFADLEAAMPSSVLVARMNVRGTSSSSSSASLSSPPPPSSSSGEDDAFFVELDLAVVGRSPADVTRMITEWDRAGRFIAEPLTEQPQTGRGQTGSEWTLRVIYRPRPGTPTRHSGEETSNSMTTAGETTTAAASRENANGEAR